MLRAICSGGDVSFANGHVWLCCALAPPILTPSLALKHRVGWLGLGRSAFRSGDGRPRSWDQSRCIWRHVCGSCGCPWGGVPDCQSRQRRRVGAGQLLPYLHCAREGLAQGRRMAASRGPSWVLCFMFKTCPRTRRLSCKVFLGCATFRLQDYRLSLYCVLGGSNIARMGVGVG